MAYAPPSDAPPPITRAREGSIRATSQGSPSQFQQTATSARGIESGVLRQDLAADVLLELFGGALVAALKLTQHGQLGLEEATAAAASVFLNGARAR